MPADSRDRAPCYQARVPANAHRFSLIFRAKRRETCLRPPFNDTGRCQNLFSIASPANLSGIPSANSFSFDEPPREMMPNITNV